MSNRRSTEPLSPEAFASANAAYWRAYHASPASTHEGAHEVALRAALEHYLDREVARLGDGSPAYPSTSSSTPPTEGLEGGS